MTPLLDRVAKDANTHFVGNAGLGMIAASIGVHIAAHLCTAGAWHPTPAVSLTIGDLDTYLSPLAVPGALAAYFGRPLSVPRDSKAVGTDASPSPAQPALATPNVAGTTGGRVLMASLIQELGLIETIAEDVVEFAAGKPASTTKTIGNLTYSASVVVLPNGATGTPYQVLGGGFLAILGMAFADYAMFSAGAPIQIAEKVGNTWYGTTLSIAPVATPAPAASVVAQEVAAAVAPPQPASSI